MTRSDYHVVKHVPGIVWLVDLDLGRMSVTNDAEAVVASIDAEYPDCKIYYRDSAGCWDELVHDHGRFIDFKVGAPGP
jgi:hypothetical protein